MKNNKKPVVGMEGLEPSRTAPPDFKSGASAYSATLPYPFVCISLRHTLIVHKQLNLVKIRMIKNYQIFRCYIVFVPNTCSVSVTTVYHTKLPKIYSQNIQTIINFFVFICVYCCTFVSYDDTINLYYKER